MQQQASSAVEPQQQGYRGANPLQVEQAIRQGADMLDGIVEALKTATDRRYDTESAHRLKVNQRIDYYMLRGRNATHARARANVEAQPEWEAHLQAKAEWHYLEDLRKALETRLYGLMNVNKAITATYNGTR